jgi:hypothetical protein
MSGLIMLMASRCYASDFVVVTHPQSGIEKMSKDEIINIYMGRNHKMPNGLSAIPIDVTYSTENKARFYMYMMEKELAEINSYWARLRFSGQGNPPKQIGSVEEVIEFVSRNKGALAYLDKKRVDKRVRIVFDSSQISH